MPLPKPGSQPTVRAPSSTSTPGSRANINAFASNPNGPLREAAHMPVQPARPSVPPAAFRDGPPAPAPIAALNVSGNGPSGNGHFEQVVTAFQSTMQQFLDYQLESNRQRQELMSRFLDTQRAMVEVLAGNGNGHHGSGASTAPVYKTAPQVAPSVLLPELSKAPTETVAPVALSAAVIEAPAWRLGRKPRAVSFAFNAVRRAGPGSVSSRRLEPL